MNPKLSLKGLISIKNTIPQLNKAAKKEGGDDYRKEE